MAEPAEKVIHTVENACDQCNVPEMTREHARGSRWMVLFLLRAVVLGR